MDGAPTMQDVLDAVHELRDDVTTMRTELDQRMTRYEGSLSWRALVAVLVAVGAVAVQVVAR